MIMIIIIITIAVFMHNAILSAVFRKSFTAQSLARASVGLLRPSPLYLYDSMKVRNNGEQKPS